MYYLKMTQMRRLHNLFIRFSKNVVLNTLITVLSSKKIEIYEEYRQQS